MNATLKQNRVSPLVLQAETAADLMTANILSIPQDASLLEAAVFLREKEISAAPVIDNAGRPVGVLSQTDIMSYQNATATHTPDFYHVADLFCPPAFRERRNIAHAEHTLVQDVMTPRVIAVTPHDSVLSVVRQLVDSRIHRLFVIDGTGVLVGVISVLDVLRRLQANSRSQNV